MRYREKRPRVKDLKGRASVLSIPPFEQKRLRCSRKEKAVPRTRPRLRLIEEGKAARARGVRNLEEGVEREQKELIRELPAAHVEKRITDRSMHGQRDW